MSVNMSGAVQDKDKHERFGRNYFEIDFEINEGLTENQYRTKDEKGRRVYPNIGTLTLGNKRYPVTYKELEKLYDTIVDTKYQMEMAYTLGLLK